MCGLSLNQESPWADFEVNVGVLKVDWEGKLHIELSCLHFGRGSRVLQGYYWMRQVGLIRANKRRKMGYK